MKQMQIILAISYTLFIDLINQLISYGIANILLLSSLVNLYCRNGAWLFRQGNKAIGCAGDWPRNFHEMRLTLGFTVAVLCCEQQVLYIMVKYIVCRVNYMCSITDCGQIDVSWIIVDRQTYILVPSSTYDCLWMYICSQKWLHRQGCTRFCCSVHVDGSCTMLYLICFLDWICMDLSQNKVPPNPLNLSPTAMPEQMESQIGQICHDHPRPSLSIHPNWNRNLPQILWCVWRLWVIVIWAFGGVHILRREPPNPC